jgi:hypothetical protein
MKIELHMIKENPDGSADVTVEYDEEGLQALLERAIISIIKDSIEKEKQTNEPQSESRKTPPAFIQSNKRHNIKRRNKLVL